MTFAPCLDVYHCFAVGNFIGKVGLKDKPPRALRNRARQVSLDEVSSRPQSES